VSLLDACGASSQAAALLVCLLHTHVCGLLGALVRGGMQQAKEQQQQHSDQAGQQQQQQQQQGGANLQSSVLDMLGISEGALSAQLQAMHPRWG